MVLDWSGIAELRFLGNSDELLDVVPLTLEKRGEIRYGVICGVHGRYARDDGELAASVSLGEFVLQIEPRRVIVEQVDNLDVGASRNRLAPVGIEYLGDSAFASAGVKRQ